MDDCTCPKDFRSIPPNKRVLLIEPGAEAKRGAKAVTTEGVHVFHADCPVHGYSVIPEDPSDPE